MEALYTNKVSFSHRLDPRTKLIMLVMIVASAFILNDPAHLLIYYVALLVIVAMSNVVQQYISSLKVLALLCFMILMIHGLFNPIGETPIFTLYGNFSFKQEALIYACVLALRIFIIGTGAMIFVTTTHPSDLASALLKWHVSHAVSFMFLSIFQIIPIIAREAKIVTEAQQARCLELKGSLLKRVKNLIPLFAPLFIITFTKIFQLSKVLECRAFSSQRTKTSFREMKIETRDYLFLILISALLISTIMVRMQLSGFTTPSLLLIILFSNAAIVFISLLQMLLSKLIIKSRSPSL